MIFTELTDVFDHYRTDKDIFHDLMPAKMQEILLVATLYDAFILERDGQLSEQIFGEYYQLNLTSAPRITSAYSREDALRKLDLHTINMVIFMVGLDIDTPLEIAREIKELHDIPILLLFNNSVALPLCPPADSPEMAPIDRVFVWNGYSRIFLAMTKYVEDYLNVDNDTALGMVQVILLIEDSVRFYSRYLPVLYVEIMRQTQRLISEENLDEMNKLLRMRARPKVLLATNHEQAIALYERYRDNLLAVITDVHFPKEGSSDHEAGLNFVSMLKEDNPDLPVLVQSSEMKNQKTAYDLGASFMHKASESLDSDLKRFFTERLGFGCFVFRSPDGVEIGRVHNLEEFERRFPSIPDESLLYHGSRNHFSAWLMAHGEVLFARILRSARIEDFDTAVELRSFILSIFERVRILNVKGRVVHFDEYVFADANCIARLANGSLGGKGRGTTFINHLVENIDFSGYVEGLDVRIPKTAIIGIDAFEHFLETYQSGRDLYHEEDYDVIRANFLETPLPEYLVWKLRRFLQLVTGPLAVRSSGLFEDMLLQPFAGIYDTFLIPNNHPDPEIRFRQLEDAIRLVYASIFSPRSKAYFDVINYHVEEERMAIVLQEVVGGVHGNYLYPHISGTAQSHNFYPVAGLAPEDGVANLALGLGTYVVDGEQCFRFSPRHPRMDIVAPEAQAGSSQRHFYALDLGNPAPPIHLGEQSCYARLDIAEAEQHQVLNLLASVYDLENHRLQPGLSRRGPRILNFANILKYDAIPLAKTIEILLEIGEKALGNPVEIEFAVDLDKRRPDGNPTFYLLQLKPLIHRMDEVKLEPEELRREDAVLFTDQSMGNGQDATIRDIVFADPANFDNGHTLEMVQEVEEMNRSLKADGRKAVFIGFGRWGTRDRWLGIPIQFHQISQARVLVEADLPHFHVDSSLGSHFFHNLTSMNIGYFTINIRSEKHFVDWDWLMAQTPVKTTAHFRHVRTAFPLEILMDGRRGLSLIRKPTDGPRPSELPAQEG
ncbi:pyruvate, phosphate dikinase [Myxococcota bacterium]|nr:pyruvate, phosphate dikinase [Myxococcota bacterium]